jgi:hypothetical protein
VPVKLTIKDPHRVMHQFVIALLQSIEPFGREHESKNGLGRRLSPAFIRDRSAPIHQALWKGSRKQEKSRRLR